MNDTPKRILLTGAAGFVGFHLAQHLHKRGDILIGLDNFNDYYDPSLKRGRQKILKELGISIVEGDLCDSALLNSLVKEHEVTHFVNLAAQAGVRYSLENPQAYIRSNIEGFVNVLEACRLQTDIKLIYASSSSIYGLNEEIPFHVNHKADQPASLYGATKKSNELMAHAYHHIYGLAVTGLRFFTVYGPWGRPDMAYYSFTRDILEGRPIKVFNHGKMMRDFTYIDDIVKGTTAAIDLGADFEVFNLGNNQPVELGYFIETLEKLIGKKAEKTYLDMQAGDVLKTFADIDHSKQLLGYDPKISIEKGLENFVNWYKAEIYNKQSLRA
ncbi:UDP-glucuronate 4-epimerase 4 [Chlamydiales bacterium SCGC AG-110-M15]|nr:UDP-glucuronate 4-epimerase 4 [Chlamydiales bacterium SCGC AG-110-M15]